MNLEHDLREALKRKEPPSGFDASVLERIANGERASALEPPDRWRRVVLPVAASLLLAVGAGLYVEQRRELQSRQDEQQRQAALAQDAAHDVALALLIASEKVSAAQAKVLEITHESHTEY